MSRELTQFNFVSVKVSCLILLIPVNWPNSIGMSSSVRFVIPQETTPDHQQWASAGNRVYGLSQCFAERTAYHLYPRLCSRTQTKHYPSQQNRHCTVDHWKAILWSDDLHYIFFQSDGCVCVWWMPGEQLLTWCIVPAFNFGSCGILIWKCFLWYDQELLHVVPSTI